MLQHILMTVSITAAQMQAVSFVPAVKASYSVELELLLDSSSDSGLLSFVSSSFFVPLANLTALSSLLTCHANCVHPNMPSLTITRPPSAVEDSFLTYTKVHDVFASISHQIMTFLGSNSDGQIGFSCVPP